MEELKSKGFDAVFLALGAMRGTMMGIEGEDDPRVLDGVSVLQDINLGRETNLGDNVGVVGGGDVAIDVARNALRLGSKNVIMLYRRSRDEMPADPDEIHEALAEKVDIRFLNNPVKVVPGKDSLTVVCQKMELGPPDDSGRRRPVPIPGSEYELELSSLVMAIGQKPIVPEGLGVKLDKWKCIDVNDEMCACNEKGIFAAGDAVTGPGVAIEAIEGGRNAASAIDKFLGGDGEIHQTFYERKPYDPNIGREEGFAGNTRTHMPLLPADTRINSFDQVELGFEDLAAMTEAQRCLSCQLRMEISKAPLPSDFKK
jgi:formate dehydrogenase (NADP+) beta subunit